LTNYYLYNNVQPVQGQQVHLKPGDIAMAEESKKVEIPLEKIEALVPGYRILSHDDLWGVYRALRMLWEQSKGLPEDFRQKLFAVEQHFYYYLVNEPGPYRPTMAESLARLKELLPDRD